MSPNTTRGYTCYTRNEVQKGTLNRQHLHKNAQDRYKFCMQGIHQPLLKYMEKLCYTSDWDKGLFVKPPKKGDLQHCDNWRGMTLLSVPIKIFCRALQKRIVGAMDANMCPEQPGFRRGT